MTKQDAHGYLHLEINQAGECLFRDYEAYQWHHDIADDMDESMAEAIYAQIGDVKDCLVLVTFKLTYETSYDWESGYNELDAVIPTVLSHTVVVHDYKEFMRHQINEMTDSMKDHDIIRWQTLHDEEYTPPEKKVEPAPPLFCERTS